MVCTYWREIVTSAPRLWSSFHIDFESHIEQNAAPYAKFTSLFLNRSKTSPLHLSISFPCELHSSLFGVDATLKLLVDHSHRWESLKVTGVEYISHFRSGALSLPNLRQLYLYTNQGNSEELVALLPSFSDCPSLTSVRLDVAVPTDKVMLPWSQVRNLTLINRVGLPMFSALAQCRNLERLTLDGIDTGSHVYDEDDIAESLQHFSLLNLNYLEVFNNHLRMPKDRHSSIPIVLERFIPRSGITSLALHHVPLTDSQVLSLLHDTPALRCLSIREYKGEKNNRIVTRAFSQRLSVAQDTIDLSHPSFLPDLSELKLSIHVGGLDEQALADALTSRWLLASRCLNRVEIALISKEKPPSGSLFALKYFNHVGVHSLLSHSIPVATNPMTSIWDRLR
ncbi:hypothetical protein PM082_021134 [Marasmius tenuissimus]|nr:hypothetical protein PM082_021134 [Marasmius tenuissimus]